MNNCTPNDTKNVRSLYFVVKDELLYQNLNLSLQVREVKLVLVHVLVLIEM